VRDVRDDSVKRQLEQYEREPHKTNHGTEFQL
jgi:hypothetical protein